MFFVYWLPIAVYCLLIYVQSSKPALQSFPDIINIDKLLHFAAYAVLGALFMRAFEATASKSKSRPRRLMVFSILAASLYGISDEIHQAFVVFRSADAFDALADICGSIAGAPAYRFLATKIKAVKSAY